MISIAVTLGLLGTLIAVVVFDLRQMRIPNLLSFILLGIFVLLCFDLSFGEIGMRLALATGLFVIGFLGFMFRMLGGGDVKILSALALFVPLAHAAEIMLVFSASLLIGTVAVLLCRKLIEDGGDWAFLNTTRMPMGLPIGCCGIISLLVPLAS